MALLQLGKGTKEWRHWRPTEPWRKVSTSSVQGQLLSRKACLPQTQENIPCLSLGPKLHSSLPLAFRALECAPTPAMDLRHLWDLFWFLTAHTKHLHKAFLCCVHAVSVKLPRDTGSYWVGWRVTGGSRRRSSKFWVPPTLSHWCCQRRSRPKGKKWIRRHREPQTSASQAPTLQVLFKRRFGFSRAGAGPRFCVSNKLLVRRPRFE